MWAEAPVSCPADHMSTLGIRAGGAPEPPLLVPLPGALPVCLPIGPSEGEFTRFPCSWSTYGPTLLTGPQLLNRVLVITRRGTVVQGTPHPLPVLPRHLGGTPRSTIHRLVGCAVVEHLPFPLEGKDAGITTNRVTFRKGGFTCLVGPILVIQGAPHLVTTAPILHIAEVSSLESSPTLPPALWGDEAAAGTFGGRGEQGESRHQH